MSRVIAGLVLSLDGYANDITGSLEKLYPNLEALLRTAYLRESMVTTGAAVMGRRTYGMAENQPDGLEGYEYQVPIFIVTHQRPQHVVPGENENLKLIFVTDGIASAVAQARAAAGERDVQIIGGASTLRQVINQRLYDELHIIVAPVILGSGTRLFDGVLADELELVESFVLGELSQVVLRYRPRRARQ